MFKTKGGGGVLGKLGPGQLGPAPYVLIEPQLCSEAILW